MTNLKDLLAIANGKIDKAKPKAADSKVKTKEQEKFSAHKTKVESRTSEANQFDELEQYIDDAANTSVPPNFMTGFSKDGNQLEVGDPVVGVHKGQNTSGTVVGVEGDNVTVEWKDKTVTEVKAQTLQMTNVDDDYELETMYIESYEPAQNMGFDKESFNEDGDLEDLLRGGATSSSSGLSYNLGDL